MMGYTIDEYRLWNQKIRNIVIARDVRFVRDCFPYLPQIQVTENPQKKPRVGMCEESRSCCTFQ